MLYRTKILTDKEVQHFLSSAVQPEHVKIKTPDKDCFEIRGFGSERGGFTVEELDFHVDASDHQRLTLSNARTGYTYKEYRAGQGYAWHSDEVVSADGLRLDVSTTLFLNEPHEYEGGELDLRFGDFCISIKLPAGYAVMYPTGLLHRVKTVKSGVRKVIHWWDQSNIQNPFIRDSVVALDADGSEKTDLYISQLERFC
jgi:PKHD-type hydroxylase